jgi:hypothetical protein
MIPGVLKGSGMLVFALAALTRVGHAPPDFSGRWVVASLDPPEMHRTHIGEKVALPQPMIYGPEFTLVQNATTVTINREVEGRSWRAVYNLDGSETRNLEGPFVMISTARWKGATLEVRTRQADTEPTPENIVTRELSLNADGTMLVRATAGKRDLPDTVYKRELRSQPAAPTCCCRLSDFRPPQMSNLQPPLTPGARG